MPETFTCAVCSVEFKSYVTPRVYCSRACMTVAYRERFAGPDNPAWRGGKWKYKGVGWDSISASVLRGASCVYCDGAPVVAHHVIPQRFWRDLDRANYRANLVACCDTCHGARPEHYWSVVPDNVFDPELHVLKGTRRLRRSVPPLPGCVICGETVKRRRARFCSYGCSNRSRWISGVYGPELARNITRTRWQAAQSVRDVEAFREARSV